MTATLSRPSRLLIYIACVSGAILLFRFFKVTVPEPEPGSLGGPGQPPKPVAEGMSLRILPLGDSITYGDGSSDGNAYRLNLHQALRLGGTKSVDMIGSQSSGKENLDNQHEGWGGARISHVLEKVLASGTLRQHPNVVLLHAGTNDLKEADPPVPDNVDEAPHRLGVLMDAILCECPDTLLMVAKITGQRPPKAQERVQNFNAAIEGVIAERKARGAHVRMVDQSHVMALELADDLHPNDAGYRKMAQNWLAALQGSPLEWFKEAGELPTELPPKVCDKDDSYFTGLMKPAPLPPAKRR